MQGTNKSNFKIQSQAKSILEKLNNTQANGKKKSQGDTEQKKEKSLK